MNDVFCNPFNVVALAGKRIRMMPIEDVATAEINDPENHGVPIVMAPLWDIAKTVAAYEGTWGLIYQRADRYLIPLVCAMYQMPVHDEPCGSYGTTIE